MKTQATPRTGPHWPAALLGAAALLAAGTPARVQDPPRPQAATIKQLAAEVKKLAAAEYESLETLYKHLHAHPELALHEEKTAARLAGELKKAGFTVTEKVGGFGVVGVLRNGKGPTVLIRTEMDGLPVTEKTGLPYASKVRARTRDGLEVGVMHACGHDINMTCWVGTARVLAALKDRWRGTLLFIAQPAEEIGAGARMMLEAGLFKVFPRPDYSLALHCDAVRPHGTVAYTDGDALANVDRVEITVRGKGGHGARPHKTVDPIVLAARLILDLQTLVSRETSALDPAVVTVGSIHGGTEHNIIPDEVKLKLTVRSTRESVRKHLLFGIKRKAEAAALGAGAPPPLVKFDLGDYTPALRNDHRLVHRTVTVFREVLGADNVLERLPVMGGEDFSRFGREGVPIFIFFLGTVPPERVAEAKLRPLPSLHSELYYPVPEPTIKTGVLAMSTAALNLLGR
jgi:hippurate hydrolase